MKYVFWILLSLTFTSCGKAPTTVSSSATASTWTATDQMTNVSNFVSEAALRGYTEDVSSLTLQYSVDVDSTHWAICNFDSSGNPVISLATDVARQSAAFQEILIFHELGHCILWRQHNGAVSIPLGGPASLMNSSLVNITQYSNNRSAYLDELFSIHGSSKPSIGS